MKNTIKLLSFLLIGILVFTACTALTQTGPDDTIATVQSGIETVKPEIDQQITSLPATLESMATQYAPTIENFATSIPATLENILPGNNEGPYKGEVKSIQTEDFTMNLAVEVAANAKLSNEEASDNFGYPAPAHRAILFDGYVIPEHFHTPVIYVYPVEEFKTLNPTAAETIANLQTLLEDPNRDLQVEESLPFLPHWNAAQVFHALFERLDSEYARGIRYLTEFSQAYVGISNETVFYTYQGLSIDGKYYIAAVLPVNSSLLDGNESLLPSDQTNPEDYEKITANTVAKLLAENGGVVTPSLKALDAMMMSLKILK